MTTKQRPRRPYEKKTVSRRGIIVFSIGFVAILIIIGISANLMSPYLGPRIDSVSYHLRTYYRKLIPHPEYLPTPAPISSSGVLNSPPRIPLTTTPRPTVTITTPPTITPVTQNTPTTLADPATQEGLAATIESTAGLSENDADELPLLPVGDNILLTGFNHQWQTWNNCGPATITTYISYFGQAETQAEAANFLKPNQDDKNVNPEELTAYARQRGMGALLRRGGNLEQLKLFLSNDFPVLLETWLVHDGDGLGHYRLISGFNETTQQFSTTDSLNGPEYTVSYDQLDADWRVFNRLYIVVYPPEQVDTIAAIIGEDMNDTVMYERLLAEAQANLETNPEDPIAYFNQGEALTRLNRPDEAVVAFDQARRLGLHWRRLWYQFTPFEAYYTAGRYRDVLDLAQATLKSSGGLEEAYYYHGLALQATNQPGAAEDFEAALAYNPNFTLAAEALRTLEAN